MKIVPLRMDNTYDKLNIGFRFVNHFGDKLRTGSAGCIRHDGALFLYRGFGNLEDDTPKLSEIEIIRSSWERTKYCKVVKE